LIGAALALSVTAPAGAQELAKKLDRRFPTAYCPIDNDDYDLTFTATTDRARIRIEADNFTGSTFNEQRLDNMAVVPKSLFDANRFLTPNFTACFLTPPGPQNYPSYNFTAAGTPETFFDQFPSNALQWNLSNYGWWDNVSFNFGAPNNSTTGTDRTGGALALGRDTDGAVKVSTDVMVTGLTPGTLYVITGWWNTQSLNSLDFFINTNPCTDLDADGLTDCAGDCNDADPKMRAGSAEVCDGKDNDCNGAIDDAAACVRLCTTPAKQGSDFRVTTAQFASSSPSVAWNGVDYGLLWKDSRNGDQEIFFTRMTPAGAKVGIDVPVTGSCFDCDHPQLVWNGTEYGAVWMQNDAITFRRLDRNGAAVGTDTILGDPAGSGRELPDIAWSGSEYGIAWDEFVGPLQIRFQKLDRLGKKTSQLFHITDDASFLGNTRPRLAYGGGKFGVVWQGNNGNAAVIVFRSIDARQGLLPALPITTHNFTSLAPEIAWNGSEWGVAWQDHRTFTEVYFQRVTAAGALNGAELRVTNASSTSNAPSLAWTGSEYGVVWEDFRTGDQELWFARISSVAVKVGSDLQLTTAAGTSAEPSIAWGGGKFGVAFWDDRFNGEQEIYFLRLGCNCVDGDGDTQNSCVECDDTRSAVKSGGAQICDGLNNDCDSASWPLLAGTNEADVDGDTFSACAGDCNDANVAIWATPGEVRSLVMTHNKATSTSTLSWAAPLLPGGSSDVYDTVRSATPTNFTASATCVETNDGVNTAANDGTTPAAGTAFFYLVRAENACPSGIGPLGFATGGVPTTGRTCP
jgi:hypothetical protein